MGSYSPEAAGFIEWLEGVAESVEKLEEQGREAAARKDGGKDYIGIMTEKAETLADLYDDASPYLRELAPEPRAYADARLQAFSGSANRALDIASPFYMSALLFPENHQPGQPNDLEVFIEEMRVKLAK